MQRREFLKKTLLVATAASASKCLYAQTTPAKYRVAIIGHTGRGNYGHGLDVVWQDIQNTQVIAVADPDPKGRTAAAKRIHAPNAYADYREMLTKEKPNIVSVSPRWLDQHRDMVLACAKHNCHVFLEKPMCQTLAQADEMIAAMEKRKLKLAIAHQTRYSPALQNARNLIQEGLLGDILELRGRGKEDRRGGGEDLMVLGTHIMDLMRFFGGNPQWCFATVRNKRKRVTKDLVQDGKEGIGPLAGDEIHAMYRFPNVSMGYFSTHKTNHGASKRFGLWIYGSKGICTTSTGAVPEAYVIDDPSWQPGRSGAKWKRITSNGIDKLETLKDPRHHFGNCQIAHDLIHAIETDTQPKGSMYDGRAALEMILAIYESHRQNAPISIPLKNRQHPLLLL
jgi:predicted dehydrogenase